jgi:cytochrome b
VVLRENGHPLWDLPTRLCHWLIVACVPMAWWSAETANFELHKWLGYSLIVLVVSRIIWGFVGSRHSRFSDFLVGPGRISAYLRGAGSGSAGHNPLGGWSVIALLSLLLMQAVSGLFNSDDLFFSGPFYYGASGALRDAMGSIHELTFYALLVLMAMHILVVMYHQLRRREQLLQAMLHGSASGRSGLAPAVPVARALLIVLLVSFALWGLLQLAPEPPAVMW